MHTDPVPYHFGLEQVFNSPGQHGIKNNYKNSGSHSGFEHQNDTGRNHDDADADKILRQLEDDVSAVRLDGSDVPVKLRVYESLFVPLAKWSMLLTGNYRCITRSDVQSIRDAVHSDLQKSESIYTFVNELAQRLGADFSDGVPFDKYAKAAESLLRPSSVARAVAAGAPFIERVDVLVQLIARDLGMSNSEIDETVSIIDQRLGANDPLPV